MREDVDIPRSMSMRESSVGGACNPGCNGRRGPFFAVPLARSVGDMGNEQQEAKEGQRGPLPIAGAAGRRKRSDEHSGSWPRGAGGFFSPYKIIDSENFIKVFRTQIRLLVTPRGFLRSRTTILGG